MIGIVAAYAVMLAVLLIGTAITARRSDRRIRRVQADNRRMRQAIQRIHPN